MIPKKLHLTNFVISVRGTSMTTLKSTNKKVPMFSPTTTNWIATMCKIGVNNPWTGRLSVCVAYRAPLIEICAVYPSTVSTIHRRARPELLPTIKTKKRWVSLQSLWLTKKQSFGVVAKTVGADQNVVRLRSGAKRGQQHSARAQQHYSVFRLLDRTAAKGVGSAQSVSLQSESSKFVSTNRWTSVGRTVTPTIRLPTLASHQHATDPIVYVEHTEPVLPDVVVATKGTNSVTQYSQFGKFINNNNIIYIYYNKYRVCSIV